MITKIGVLSKETFDKRVKFDKNSKAQDLLGGLCAVAVTDAANRVAGAVPVKFKTTPEVANVLSDKYLMDSVDLAGGADLRNSSRFWKAVVDNPIGEKILTMNHLKYMPAISALSTYKGTRERDRDPEDNNSKRWYAASAASLAPAIAQSALQVEGYNRGARSILVDDVTKAALKKAGPLRNTVVVSRNLVPYLLANAAGYGVAKLQDKTIDAYNKFQDKRYADTEALLKARRKAKEKQ